MATFDEDTEIATIDLQDMHDVFASGIIAVKLEDGFARPQEFVLVDDKATEEDHKLCVKLNAVLRTIQDLGSEFHDQYDGAYC